MVSKTRTVLALIVFGLVPLVVGFSSEDRSPREQPEKEAEHDLHPKDIDDLYLEEHSERDQYTVHYVSVHGELGQG